jgi:hypothetical protein
MEGKGLDWIGLLGYWAIGLLGYWATGKLGDCAIGIFELGNWEHSIGYLVASIWWIDYHTRFFWNRGVFCKGVGGDFLLLRMKTTSNYIRTFHIVTCIEYFGLPRQKPNK